MIQNVMLEEQANLKLYVLIGFQLKRFLTTHFCPVASKDVCSVVTPSLNGGCFLNETIPGIFMMTSPLHNIRDMIYA